MDTALSLYHRVIFNAAFNTLLLVAAAIPLAVAKKEFTTRLRGDDVNRLR